MKQDLEALLKTQMTLLDEKLKEYNELTWVTMGVSRVKEKRSEKLAEINFLWDKIKDILFNGIVRI